MMSEIEAWAFLEHAFRNATGNDSACGMGMWGNYSPAVAGYTAAGLCTGLNSLEEKNLITMQTHVDMKVKILAEGRRLDACNGGYVWTPRTKAGAIHRADFCSAQIAILKEAAFASEKDG